MNGSWRDRLEAHLRVLYPDADLGPLADAVLDAAGLGPHRPTSPPDKPTEPRWSEADIIVIAYGDSIVDDERSPLRVLADTAEQLWAGKASTVHVLPFFPYSSDRGFAVIDHRSIDPAIGTGSDLQALGSHFDLMADLVLNHVSAESDWFRQYLAGDEPGSRFFIEVEPRTDLSAVVRPRSLPLTNRFETAAGAKDVWCTFSADQIDLDWSNPEVLLEMVRTTNGLIEWGVRFLRLDAVAYLWKEPGTSCIHRPQTHEVVKLFRTLVEARAPHLSIVTEANVPSDENIAYLGGEPGDEAHIVYNFPLAPLLVDAISRGRTDTLSAWLQASPPLPSGCTQLNFLASHDGIGLRPAEDLLSDENIDALVELTVRSGGDRGSYTAAGETRPYELNCSLWDLFGVMGDDATDTSSGTEHQLARHLCAHAVLLALRGIPALYVNSLLAVPGDRSAAEASGIRRDINRARVRIDDLAELLAAPDHPRTRAIAGLGRLMALRTAQPAFHPEADQEVLEIGPQLLGFRRERATQRILAVHNLGAAEVTIDWGGLGLSSRVDLGTGLPTDQPTQTLGPYEFVWAAATPIPKTSPHT